MNTFGNDLDFLREHKEVVILQNNDNKSLAAIVPDYQGRVMTSSSNGLKGRSYGWVNYDLISSGQFSPHINVFGGEDRFWLGPEGGQYSIFFKKGQEFVLDNWQTPTPIDIEPFKLISKSDITADFSKNINLLNYSGYKFNVRVEREISLLTNYEIEKNLNIAIDNELSCVAFKSKNTIINIGNSKWTKENGLLSIWILGMFNASDNTIVIIPYKEELDLNTKYFGYVGPERLKIKEHTILFKGDGKHRCKIGLPPINALPLFGSYDKDNNVLTILEYTLQKGDCYVNSLWEYQDFPYKGDVINSYNDGPLKNGKSLGSFYELETSSIAKELEVGEKLSHTHKTYHFEGDSKTLNLISKNVLGIELSDILI